MTITEIIQETRDLCDADSISYPNTTVLRRINSAIETLVGKIIQNCRNFPFDDENFGNISEGTITLQEGISKYTITDKFLDILEIKVKDTNGTYHIVSPTTQREESSILETLEAQSGLPKKYRVSGRTLWLNPAPVAASVTLSAGLLFKITRTSYQITSEDVTTGTLVPGIASPWHITIARIAALPYCKVYKKDRVAQLERDIFTDIEGFNGLLHFYSNRQKDRNSKLTVSRESNK